MGYDTEITDCYLVHSVGALGCLNSTLLIRHDRIHFLKFQEAAKEHVGSQARKRHHNELWKSRLEALVVCTKWQEGHANVGNDRHKACCTGHSANRMERSEEHPSELQSLMRISYAVFCLNKKTIKHMQ